MNELLPYEQQLAGKLVEAPLPNEDGAWDAMRKMLEGDEDDKVVPPVNKGCRGAGTGMLILALVVGVMIAFFMLRNGQTNKLQQQKDAKANDSTLIHKGSANNGQSVADDSLKVPNTPRINDTAAGLVKLQTPGKAQEKYKANSGVNGKHSGKAGMRISTPAAAKTTVPVQTPQPRSDNDVVINGSPLHITPKQLQSNVTDSAGGTHAVSTGVAQKANTTPVRDTSPVTQPQPAAQGGNNPVPGNSVVLIPPGKHNDTTQTTPTVTLSRKKAPGEDNSPANPKPLWFGAGIAVQQLIPVDGQKATPYNASGRKGSLGDYIPSVYARAYHGKKMLQAEFKYGAPQYAKEVAYDKKIIFHDSTTGTTISNVSRVKKTYYHQLPVSFHYNVLPNLTIGGGFVWNRFQSAVIQQETQSSAGTSVDSLVSSKLITLKRDSATAFAKSYFQFLAEAQYTWKRFSIGARYAWGLQPYLTISSSVNGQQQKERNASLNIFIRFELWQSKKKP